MHIETSPIVGTCQRQGPSSGDDDACSVPIQSMYDTASSSSDVSPSDAMSEDTLPALFRMERHYTPVTAAASCLPHYNPHPPSSCFFGAENANANANAALPIPNAEWRSKICDWSYRVVDHFRYDREVVSISMNFFDRYLVLSKVREDEKEEEEASEEAIAVKEKELEGDPDAPEEDPNSRNYQLAAMTALYLSIKLHAENGLDVAQQDDVDSPSTSGSASSRKASQKSTNVRRKKRRVKLLSFVELSRGQFKSHDIASMERTMLDTLQWRLNPPTPTAFVSYLLRHLPTRTIRHAPLVLHVLHELSRYLTELSVCLADVSTLYQPSAVAYAAVLISMDTIHTDALPIQARSAFTGSISRLSAEASAGGGTTMPALTSDSDAVRYLMGRIRTSFLPEMILDAAACPPPGSDGEAHGHPIAIAREAGLLNMDSLRGFDAISDSDDDENDLLVADDDDDMYHRRGHSARSVMDDLVGSPVRMTVSKDSWDVVESPNGVGDEKMHSTLSDIKDTDHSHGVCHRIEVDGS